MYAKVYIFQFYTVLQKFKDYTYLYSFRFLMATYSNRCYWRVLSTNLSGLKQNIRNSILTTSLEKHNLKGTNILNWTYWCGLRLWWESRTAEQCKTQRVKKIMLRWWKKNIFQISISFTKSVVYYFVLSL